MKHAASHRLHAYWDSLRGGRPAPGRDEIDPAAIRDVLASVFVLDVAAAPLPRPRDATFRLSGTRLDALFGRPLRGSSFDQLWTATSSATAASALDAVLDGRHPVAATARGGPPGRRAVDLELVLLPLDGGSGPRGRVLGALSAASTPDWMGLAAAAPLVFVSVGAIRLDAQVAGFGRRVRRPFTIHPGGRREAVPSAALP